MLLAQARGGARAGIVSRVAVGLIIRRELRPLLVVPPCVARGWRERWRSGQAATSMAPPPGGAPCAPLVAAWPAQSPTYADSPVGHNPYRPRLACQRSQSRGVRHDSAIPRSWAIRRRPVSILEPPSQIGGAPHIPVHDRSGALRLGIHAHPVVVVASLRGERGARGDPRHLDAVPPRSPPRRAPDPSRRTARVVDGLTRRSSITGVAVRRVPVAAPLVDVVAHVIEPVAIRRRRPNGVWAVAASRPEGVHVLPQGSSPQW